MADTLNQMFLEAVERCDDHTAFLVKREARWQRFSYAWALQQVCQTAFGLHAFGFARGTRLAILSENRPEWATSDFAAMAAGYVLVPLYTTLIPEQIEYILRDAEARLIFVSSMAHLETILSIRDRLPALDKIVVFYPDDRLVEDEHVISLESLKKMGEGHSDEQLRELALLAQPQDNATFVYTSGTTGKPKGAVLSHGNFVAEYVAIKPAFDTEKGDICISFLPLSHILQRVVDTFSLLNGVTLAYAESLDTLGENLREVKPTHIVAVPRVFEKIHGRIHAGVNQGSALKRGLFHWAVRVGDSYQRAQQARGSAPFFLSLKHALASNLVFKKIHAATGGNIKSYTSTGAPLSKELAEFFHAIGIKILEVYGMTELTGAVTLNTKNDYLLGSVGKPGPGVDLKLTDEGEVCIKGDLVMSSYWQMPEATQETIDGDGWLHTGDVGYVDELGFLHITDRLKELIVTAGGKNVAPQPLENALKADRFIAQAMVIGDNRNFISALIVPEAEVLIAWARENGIESELEGLCWDDRVLALYEEVVARQMARFSRYEQVRKIRLVAEEFTQQAGELTPTLKLKRRVLLSRYKELIDGMYED
jgi:long-chain acyl-CoA synthetase